jgi:hypothetical protein
MIGQHRSIRFEFTTQLDSRCGDRLLPRVSVAMDLADPSFNGFKAGPGHHARYFQLKGYDKEKRQAAISKRRGAYTA